MHGFFIDIRLYHKVRTVCIKKYMSNGFLNMAITSQVVYDEKAQNCGFRMYLNKTIINVQSKKNGAWETPHCY